MSTWRALEKLRRRRHDYLSTACRHELHDHCRGECKWCGAKCLCRCHRDAETGAEMTSAAKTTTP